MTLLQISIIACALFSASLASTPFITTSKEGTNIPFGHTLRRFSITRSKLHTETEDIREFITRSLERCAETQNNVEELCETNGCKISGYEKAPTETNHYNGYEVTKVTSGLQMARSNCKLLPTPTTDEEYMDLKRLMVTMDIDAQPLVMTREDNFLLYDRHKIFADNAGIEEDQDKDGFYYILSREAMEVTLVRSNKTGDSTFICLKERDNLAFNMKQVKELLAGIIENINVMGTLVTSWAQGATRCQTTNYNENTVGQEFSMKAQPIVANIRNMYYKLERSAHKLITIPTLKTTFDSTTAIRHQLEREKQKIKNCQIGQCAVESGNNKITFLCKEETQVKGTLIRGVTLPHSSEGKFRTLMYNNYAFDLAHQICMSFIGVNRDVLVRNNPKCCEEIAAQGEVTHCPYFIVGQAPILAEHGPYGYFTDPENTDVVAHCGADKSKLALERGKKILTDCSLSISHVGDEVQIKLPGFGVIMEGLKRFQEELPYEWRPAEIALLTVGIVLAIASIVLTTVKCCTTDIFRKFIACCRCCRRKKDKNSMQTVDMIDKAERANVIRLRL
jgi:hypothetical protein